MDERDYKPSQQPCWHCNNYAGGCEWTDSRCTKPVPGWIAIPTTKAYAEGLPTKTFKILYCPKLDDDGTENQKQRREKLI